jgi:hypothetical protein
MRLLVPLLFIALGCRLVAGPTPSELDAALKEFRAEGTKGWAFTQTTVAGDRSRVERFDPLGKNFLHWTLLQQDGRAPSADETRTYNEHKSRRTSNETPPNVKDQIAPGTCEVLEETPERGIYRFRLKPGDKDDHSAEFMRATFTLHRPTATIEKVELSSTEPFSPVLMIKIQEARTVMTYTLPEDDRPTLLKNVTVRVHGRAMWVKSLDQDMTVTYSDYVYAGKK